MEKKFIFLGIFIGSIIGGGLGSLLDHGNPFGVWGLALSTIGSFVGIWGGYKIGTL
ncbi:MAG: hypothetical protein NVS3B23_07540 [Candidatus Saccharimonadales bacterium]